jgi:hypothetical protein
MQEVFMEQGSLGFISGIVYLAICVFYIIVFWKIFTKAGKPGWACIIPVYNVIVMLEIIKRPVWWLILLIIPFVNIIFVIIISMDMAVAFEKSKVWGFFMLLILGFIGYPMLGFGSAKYSVPSRA